MHSEAWGFILLSGALDVHMDSGKRRGGGMVVGEQSRPPLRGGLKIRVIARNSTWNFNYSGGDAHNLEGT